MHDNARETTRTAHSEDAARPGTKPSVDQAAAYPAADPTHNESRRQQAAELTAHPTDVAARGVSGASSPLPHAATIQASFGRHDISAVQAQVGGPAAAASAELNAHAYATGDRIAFASAPDLHTAAHEAAHVVQQAGGVQARALDSGPGDAFEQHADAVADAVVAGESAEALLEQVPGGSPTGVQRKAFDPNAGGPEVKADAKALLTAFSGSGTDEYAVMRVLKKAKAHVQAVKAEYDANYNTHYRKGLVYDLEREFTGFNENVHTWNLVTALLKRAGIDPPGKAQAFIDAGKASKTFRIVANPAQPAVAPGTEVTYRLKQPDSAYDSRSRWTYSWHRLNDPSGDKAGKASYVEGPKGVEWKLKWGETGTHKVVCRVQFISSRTGADTARTLEFEQRVGTVDSLAKDAMKQAKPVEFGRFRAGLELKHLELAKNGVKSQDFGKGPAISNSGPNPAVPGRAPHLAHHTYTIKRPSPEAKRFRWYALCSDWRYMPTVSYHGYSKIAVDGQDAYDLGSGPSARWIIGDPQTYTIVCEELDADGNRLGTSARYVQSVMSSKDAAAVQGWRKHLALVDSKIETIAAGKRVGMKTAYVNEETGAATSPALFIGPDKANPKHIKLLDLTPGVPRSEYGGSSVAAAIADFENGNSYPVGQIELEVPANTCGVATAKHTAKTKGKSTWADWSSKLGWTSLGLAVVGIGLTLAPIPGSRVAAAAIFTSALAGGAASGLSIYDQLQQSEVSGRHIAIDVLGVAASILGARAAFSALKSGTAITLANRQGKFLLYTMAGTDVAQGILVTPDFVAAINQILNDKSLSDGARTSQIVQVIANFALTGALIALSVGDLKAARGQLQAHVDPKTLKQLDATAVGTLSTLDPKALKALKGVPVDSIKRVATVAKASPASANRLLNLLGDKLNLHQLEVTPDGLIRINKTLDIHPSKLDTITNADLAKILEATRTGDLEALKAFTASKSYRLRFAHNLDEATNFLKKTFDDLGVSNDPRAKALIDGADTPGKTRLYDLHNRSYPGGEAGKRLKTKAADYALSKTPTDLRGFVEHFEMYLSEYSRRADAIKNQLEARTQQLIDAAPTDQKASKKGLAGVQSNARKTANQEILGLDSSGGVKSKSVKPAIAKKALEDMGESLDQAGSSAKGKSVIDARAQALAKDLPGRVGSGQVKFGAPDAELIGQVQALSGVKFKTDTAAIYHANKHGSELPPTHRKGGGGLLAHYSDSAQQTIRWGKGVVEPQQGGGKQIIFTRTYKDGGKSYTMTARVNVSPDGKVTLATYGG